MEAAQLLQKERVLPGAGEHPDKAQAAEQEDIVAEVVKQLGFRDINAKDVEISYMDAGSVLASGTSAVSQKQTVQ